MLKVKALRSFEHNGSRKKGSIFKLTESTAHDLAQRGLISVVVEPPKAEERPKQAAGQKSSASPAAPVSRRRTARRSASGATAQTEGRSS